MKLGIQKRLLEAAECALRWHAGQYRKQTEIPYVSHLLQVAGLVLEHGGDPDQAAAALLHDSLEDAPDAAERGRRKQEIEERFGEDVLQIVLDCTDTGDTESLGDKRPWLERKEAYLARLTGTSQRSRLVVACDKLHNLHAVVWDVKTHGNGVFDRFTSTPEQQAWYFESITEILKDSIPDRLCSEIQNLVEALRQIVGARRGT